MRILLVALLFASLARAEALSDTTSAEPDSSVDTPKTSCNTPRCFNRLTDKARHCRLETLDSLNDIIRYNRVEGLYLGFDYDSRRKLHDRDKGLFFKAGYAVSARLVEYAAGARLTVRPLGHPIDFSIAHGRIADTEDRGIASPAENSLQMFLFGRDLFDWFQNTFTEFSGTLALGPVTLTGTLGNDTYRYLARRETFYLFGSDSNTVVRGNPGVREAEDHFLKAGARYQSGTTAFPRNGADLSVSGEYSGGFIKSELTYRKAQTDLRIYRALNLSSELGLRFFAGEIVSVTGNNNDIATQKLFDLGGVGTIRGFAHREDWAFLDKTRMAFMTAEYKTPFIPNAMRPRLFSRCKNLLLVLFADAGNSWNPADFERDNLGFDPLFPDLEPGKLHKTLGFGFTGPGEHLRLDFMRLWRWDRPSENRTEDRLSLRFNHAF